MSLINDALKRASLAKPQTPPPAELEPPLHPVEEQRPPRWPLFLGLAVVAVFFLAGWLFLKGWEAKHEMALTKLRIAARETGSDEANTNIAQTPNSPAPVSKNRPVKQTILSAPPLPTAGAAPRGPNALPSSPNALTLPGTPGSSNLQAAVLEPSKPTFPALRLQGIFYRPNHPTVMINAKTISIGDKVADARVMAITRDSVTLQWNGETKVLTIE